MKTFAFAVLLLCAAVTTTFAQSSESISGTQVKGSGVSQVVQRLEQEWVDATKTRDIDKLSQILADDWIGIGFGGDNKVTKQSYLAEVKSGGTKLQSFDFGPMDVKILGNVAVVQGSDIEKSSYKGEDTSGKWIWTDVFVMLDGKWVVVRSQTAKVK